MTSSVWEGRERREHLTYAEQLKAKARRQVGGGELAILMQSTGAQSSHGEVTGNEDKEGIGPTLRSGY